MSYGGYYNRHRSYYSGIGWGMPYYGYSSMSSFGIWHAATLWLVLDRLTQPNYYSMAYHHRSDPGFTQWRQEADRLALENRELRGKLDRLDQQVEKMEAAGVPKNPEYLPEGMPPEVALAPEVVASESASDTIPLIFAAGSPSGNYSAFVLGNPKKQIRGIKNLTDLIAIKCVHTAGSSENLERFFSGKADAILAQSDVIADYLRISRKKKLGPYQLAIYPEFIHMIARSDSGIKSVKDMEKSDRLYIGPAGSGTAATWRGLVSQDPNRYGAKRIRVKNADYDSALKAVLASKDAVMMFVSGLNSPFMQKMDTRCGKKLRLVLVDDYDFNDKKDTEGNLIYRFREIPKSTYPNMQEKLWGLSSKKIETLTVDAVLILHSRWVKANGKEAEEAFKNVVFMGLPEMRAAMGLF